MATPEMEEATEDTTSERLESERVSKNKKGLILNGKLFFFIEN